MSVSDRCNKSNSIKFEEANSEINFMIMTFSVGEVGCLKPFYFYLYYHFTIIGRFFDML